MLSARAIYWRCSSEQQRDLMSWLRKKMEHVKIEQLVEVTSTLIAEEKDAEEE